MKLQCPACAAEMDLDVLLAHEEGRHVLARLIATGTPLGAAMLRYLGLFRPAKRALSMARTLKLLTELWPDIERQAVTRKGREWAAPPAIWQAAVDQLLQSRDRGAITLPLTSHGYLYEVICGLSDKAESLAEQQVESQRRHGLPPPTTHPPPPSAPPPVAAHVSVPPPDDVRQKLQSTLSKLKGSTT